MAYIGNSPANVGNYQVVDDISSTFNGTLTSFALTASSLAINPAKSGQLLVSINGVLQEPDDTGTEGFKVSGSNIVFSSAPATGSTFWAVFQGQNVDVGTPSDNTVGNAQVADDALSGNKIDGGTISNFTSTGIDDNATSTQLTITDTNVAFGADTSCINMAVAEDIRHAGDGNTYLSFEADTLACYVGGTNTLQLTSGQMMSPTGITLGNGTTYAAANTLDDYEEGTWSGSLAGTSNPNTTQTITGTYVKVGRLVTLTCEQWSLDATGASGQVSIVGLPFTNGSTGIGASVAAHGTASLSRNIYSQYSSRSDVMPRVAAGTNTAAFYCNYLDSSNYTPVPYIGGSMSNGVIGFTITYPTT
jgi:hypothetical protein